MTQKILIRGLVFAAISFTIFYGVNWTAHHFLPKWVDILIGFPLSIYLIFKAAMLYDNHGKSSR